MRKVRDLAGLRFGRLVAKYPTDKRLGTSVIWHCDCDCGESCEVAAMNLLAGTTKSCGCIREEIAKEIVGVAYKAFSDRNHKDGTNLALISSGKSLGGKSKYRGVSYNEKKKKWYAYIKLRGKRTFLGYYDTEEDAHQARLEAEEEFFKPIIDRYSEEEQDEDNVKN